MGGQTTGAQLAYTHKQAAGYDEKRRRQLAWHRENDLVRNWSETVPRGSRVLDIPCGTGRLFPIFFARGLQVVGADLSENMLAQVPDEYRSSRLLEGLDTGDATDLDYEDRSFDYVVSLRLFHLVRIPKEAQQTMLHEFTRVARRGVVLHVPLLGRSTASRLVDAGWRLFSVRREGPVHFTRVAWKRSRARARGRARQRRTANGGFRPVWKGGVWTLSEIERAFNERGFELAEAHGAISPFSSKKILVANRVT
ncbi:MAG TPA: class I SAM-dependent methyltransferase [Longimicrobiales bacterium]|nr:class I SAM-dependent methyltransferase [Longimicrobiales bacterium]